MQTCMKFPCGWSTYGCTDAWCPLKPGWPLPQQPYYYVPMWPSRTLLVNVPLPDWGLTIVTVDKDGNVTIRVNQVQEAKP